MGAASDFSYSGQREDGIAPTPWPSSRSCSGPAEVRGLLHVLMPASPPAPAIPTTQGQRRMGSGRAVVDGASMQQGYLSQSGWSRSTRTSVLPDMVSEVKV